MISFLSECHELFRDRREWAITKSVLLVWCDYGAPIGPVCPPLAVLALDSVELGIP